MDVLEECFEFVTRDELRVNGTAIGFPRAFHELFIATGDPDYFGRISTLRLICYTVFCVELNGLNNKHMCRRLGVLFLFLSCCVFLDGAR